MKQYSGSCNIVLCCGVALHSLPMSDVGMSIVLTMTPNRHVTICSFQTNAELSTDNLTVES